VFGLVAIPIKVYSTSEPGHEVHFHLIHAGCGQRLKQQYACPKHGKVDREDIAKGYPATRTTMIELDPDEIDALDAVGTGEIALREFVPAAAVDPIFVDRTYSLGPGKRGERPYRLLRDALADAELVGIATYAARGKAYVVMVRPFESGLAMHQLRYRDEIKPWREVGVHALPAPARSELALAQKLVDQLRRDTFDPAAYKDEVKARVRKLLAEKVKTGETIEAEPEAPPAAIPDLMAALRASLGADGAEARGGHRPRRASRRKSAARPAAHRGTKRATATRRAHR
jgi:DNA end-binding protein Ku